jgi:hypothetical protein
MIPVASLSLELHPPLFPPESLNLYLAGGVPSRGRLRYLSKLVAILVELFLGEVLLVLTILDVNGEALGGQEPEPLQGLRVQTYLGEGVLPVGETQVHDHQTEIVCESVRYEKPRA